jgi:ABC-type lipoprotein export system ATPase subunit
LIGTPSLILLLQELATIDKQTSGHVLVNGEEINQMRAAKLAEFRRTHNSANFAARI